MSFNFLELKNRVGTSGYTYFWNPGKPSPFKWYVSRGFRTVEINASFYRFPQRSWVSTWLRDSPGNFDFSVKIHRSITHRSRLGPSSPRLWEKFLDTLRPMLEKISFFLFQFPEYFRPSRENLLKVKSFVKDMELEGIAVVEFRHPGWWNLIKEIEHSGAVFCSVDAPDLPRSLVLSNDAIYLRIHGRTAWYAYRYSDHELEELAEKLIKLRAQRTYVYFNNDHGMLENAVKMMKLLESR